jgi:ribosome-associated protein
LATKKTTGTGKSNGKTTSKSKLGSTKPSGSPATSASASRTAPPKRAKLTERPKLKVGSRPVSAVPRKAKPIARPPEDEFDDDVAPERPAAPPARTASIPPPKGAVPARARAGKAAPKKVASKDDVGRSTALAIAEIALDKKALNVEIIDVRGKVDYADYVVLMSGRSDRQVSALARSIEEDLKRKEKIRCSGVEGLGQGSWVLMDFNDVIVHIFHEDMRGYYDLESLWNDAGRVDVAQ